MVVEEVVVAGVTVAAAEATVAVGDEASDVGDATVVVVGATVIVDDETGDVLDDIVNTPMLVLGIVKDPTALQLPAVAHDTEEKSVEMRLLWAPIGNSAILPNSHTPFVEVMVNPSFTPFVLGAEPTPVQFPAVAHDTEVKLAGE